VLFVSVVCCVDFGGPLWSLEANDTYYMAKRSMTSKVEKSLFKDGVINLTLSFE